MNRDDDYERMVADFGRLLDNLDRQLEASQKIAEVFGRVADRLATMDDNVDALAHKIADLGLSPRATLTERRIGWNAK